MQSASDSTPPQIDASVPHSARIFNWWLGGKDNYAVDQMAGARILQTFPGMADLALAGRQFLGRTVRHLTEEEGIRQFLDIGTGLPTADNTHEVAQRSAPDSRIVYVDNDPLVLHQAHALLTSTREGACAYIDADVHEPERILRLAERTLDLERPVAVVLMGILAHVQEYEEARSIVRRLMEPLPPGSFLVVRDGTDTDPDYAAALEWYNANSGAVPYILRGHEEIEGFFDGLELLPPGLVSCPLWRPEAAEPGTRRAEEAEEPAVLGGVGRKALP
ncbi:SAM-dependent methyltransferase [Streptomyces daliensis]